MGCSTPVTQVKSAEDNFADIIRDNIKNNALKNNADCRIYSLNILNIDTITGSTLDTQSVTKASERLEICNTMADLYVSMSQTNTRINALNKKKKDFLPGIDSEDQDDSYRAQLYRDSAAYYDYVLDSLGKINTRNKKFSDTVYQIRSFIKATERKNNDSVSYFGLKCYYISKNNQVLDTKPLPR